MLQQNAVSELRGHQRIQEILQILNDGKPHQAGRIAFQLGVSARTIRRTLHQMRDDMKMPIQVGTKGFFIEGALPMNSPMMRQPEHSNA